jgi:hypothetical protein
MTKVDLKDAYFMIPIWAQDRPSISENKCSSSNAYYLAYHAPQHKTLKPVAAQLRELGVKLIVYTDDILIMAESREKPNSTWWAYVRESGVHHKPRKSILEPTQEIEFLGFTINSVDQTLSLQQKR